MAQLPLGQAHNGFLKPDAATVQLAPDTKSPADQIALLGIHEGDQLSTGKQAVSRGILTTKTGRC